MIRTSLKERARRRLDKRVRVIVRLIHKDRRNARALSRFADAWRSRAPANVLRSLIEKAYRQLTQAHDLKRVFPE